MKKSLLATAAAVALLAGPGLASAQKNEAPTPAPAQQQNAPAEKIAPAVKGAPAKGAETNMPQAKPQTTGQAEPKGDKAKAEQLPAKNGAKNAQTPASPAAKNGASDKADVKASDSKSDAKPSAAQVPAQQNQQTTGKAAAPNLSAEQRTKISAAVKQQNVPRATNVNFSISIGTHVPRSLRLYALPASVVEFYPAWRGYEFILVGNEILVIDPRTLEIVAILEV